MENKVIVSGHLEFGAVRNFDQVVKLFEHRRENYYRNEVFLNAEDIFKSEAFTMDIPRVIVRCTDRQWRNTANLLKQITEFAVAGDLNIWRIREEKDTEHLLLEPKGDKSATQAFLRGRELSQEGKESEACEALSEAITRFARHATAYERRGFVNYRMGRFDDAVKDYTKSIDINSCQSGSFYGRGMILMRKGNWEAAAADFTEAIRHTIPHQAMYWKARCLKGDCLMQLEDFAGAVKEYQFFLKRRRMRNDRLTHWERRIAFTCGKALMELGRVEEAHEAFRQAIQSEEDPKAPGKPEILVHRGIAAKQLGQDDFVKDWKEAATGGSQRAVELLETLS